MITITIDTSEIHALARDLTRAADTVTPKVEAAVARTGFRTVAYAQVVAPVDTGALKNSIGVDIDGLSFKAGPTVEHGAYVELGTSRMAAQPYLGPAFDRALEQGVNEIGEAGQDIL